MLKLEQPKINTLPFKKPLLSLPTVCSKQLAANALRHWWYISSDRTKVTDGLIIQRSDVQHRNNEGNDKAHLVQVITCDEDGRFSTLLVVFSDNSAVVMRCNTCTDECRVLPAVLKLTTSARLANGSHAVTLKMRKLGRGTIGLAMSPEGSPGDFLTIDYATAREVGQSYEMATEVTRALQLQASAWARQIDGLPGLFWVENGTPSSGFLAKEDLEKLNLPTDKPIAYATPSFLPWCSLSQSQSDIINATVTDAMRWMLIRLGDPIEEIHLDIDLARPQQVGQDPKPDIKIKAMSSTLTPEALAALHRWMHRAFLAMLREEGDLDPLQSAEGHGLMDYRRRPTWLETYSLCRRFCTRDHLARLSAHERMQLHARFDRYWPILNPAETA